jgi:Protein of unknown function (DUF3551)
MRVLLAVVSLMLWAHADRAAAQNYPWCASGSYKGGARSCGFVSFEQCMASIKGSAEFCERNYAVADDGRPARPKLRAYGR